MVKIKPTLSENKQALVTRLNISIMCVSVTSAVPKFGSKNDKVCSKVNNKWIQDKASQEIEYHT
jgi:hypothetical protein